MSGNSLPLTQRFDACAAVERGMGWAGATSADVALGDATEAAAEVVGEFAGNVTGIALGGRGGGKGGARRRSGTPVVTGSAASVRAPSPGTFTGTVLRGMGTAAGCAPEPAEHVCVGGGGGAHTNLGGGGGALRDIGALLPQKRVHGSRQTSPRDDRGSFLGGVGVGGGGQW